MTIILKGTQHDTDPTEAFAFRIPYPETAAGRKNWNREYGLNAIYAGKHWSRRRTDAEYWHALTVSALNRTHPPKTPFQRPVVISFLWNDGLDMSNHAYMAKMIEDAMKGRIIKDDSGKYVVGMEHYFHDKPWIEVRVTEVTA